MKFLDLHCHPVLKTLFREQNNAISAWVPFTHSIRLVNGLESQCALDQVCDIGMNLLCFTRHAVEKGMVDQWLIRVVSRLHLYPQLDPNRLAKMAHGAVSYTQQINDEWQNLNKTPHDGCYPKQKLKYLQKLADYNEGDKTTLHLIFNIEGGHLFNELSKTCEDVDLADVRSLLKKLKDECPIIFYITPTHLTPNNLITHAYGNKILSKKPFLPNSFGICKTGRLIIDEIYKNNILVDVKHMSLISRMQFYKFHDKEYKDMPIIASHAGFTGLSLESLASKVEPIRKGKDFIKIRQTAADGIVHMKSIAPISETFNSESTRHTPRQTKFNPNSINLYEEEIIQIIKSEGLIGIIFDVRILGAAISNSVTEFLSKDEYKEWHRLFKVPGEDILRTEDFYLESNEEVLYSEEDVDEYLEELDLYFPDEAKEANRVMFSEEYTRYKEEEHLLHFINHLLYIAKLDEEKKFTVNPWKHICIGSDFDGLIASMYCCRNATYLPDFAQKLKQRVPVEAHITGIKMPTEINEFIDDLFFKNAYRILEKHLKKIQV